MTSSFTKASVIKNVTMGEEVQKMFKIAWQWCHLWTTQMNKKLLILKVVKNDRKWSSYSF